MQHSIPGTSTWYLIQLPGIWYQLFVQLVDQLIMWITAWWMALAKIIVVLFLLFASSMFWKGMAWKAWKVLFTLIISLDICCMWLVCKKFKLCKICHVPFWYKRHEVSISIMKKPIVIQTNFDVKTQKVSPKQDSKIRQTTKIKA